MYFCYRKVKGKDYQCDAWVAVVKITSKFGEFISPAEVALVCLKFILSFIKFCSLVTKLWLICGF